jgi:hypothetical protein
MEQLARDTRICTMYEGTTGIQAIDLLARKIIGSNGELLKVFATEMKRYCAGLRGQSQFNAWANAIDSHVDEWIQISTDIAQLAKTNPDEIGAASVDYLMYAGYITVGYFWLQMAVTAQQKLDAGTSETDFYRAKLMTAKFYFDRMLTRTRSLVSAINSGSENLMQMEEALFSVGK